MNYFSRRALFALFTILILVGMPAAAQTVYGSLAGTVYDASNAVISAATVTIRGVDTGFTREVKADTVGFWRAPSLLPGRYMIEVSMAGFEKVIRGPITVEPTVERAVDVTLKPGSTTEVVTITEETPLIEATRAQISRGVETRQILELPGFNTQAGLALLQPGAAPNQNGRPGSGFVVNGARSRSNNFMLDGANNNDQSLSIPTQSVPAEALGEFRIVTNNFSAEFGRNSGSVVQQTTKGGTNEFHGIARWSWSGNGYNALRTGEQRTFNAQRAAGLSDYSALRKSRAVNVQNDMVLSGGGPIVKDKHFYFLSYDRNWYRTSAVPITTALSQESIALLEQNQSAFASGVVQYIKSTYPIANDPTARGTQRVTLPDGRALTLNIQQYNRATAEGGALSYGTNNHRGLARTDHRFGEKDTVSARVLIDRYDDPGSPAAIPINQIGQATRNYSVTGNHVRVFTPSLVSEARFSYINRSLTFPENLPAQFQAPGLPTLGNQNYPQFRKQKAYEWTSNWSWTRGRHTMRFGGNYMLIDMNSFFAPSLRGVIAYPSFSDLLFDRNATFSQYAGTGEVPARTHEFQGFFGDDWRVTSELTLNLGIRYEYTSVPFGFFSDAKPDVNNWAPRVGFAWSPKARNLLFGDGQFVMRGGYAISYDQVFQNILLNNSRNYPRGVSISEANLTGRKLWIPENRPAAVAPEEYVRRGGNPLTLPYRLYSPNERIQQPYSQQLSLGIERQFAQNYVFKVFYVGTRGINLVREVERNLGFFQRAIDKNPTLYAPVIAGMKPTTVSGLAALRVDPTRGSILIGDGLAMSNYHSLQTTVEKRFTNGLQFQVNYTWSTFISESDDILGGQANRTLPAVPFNLKLDKGRSGYDQPHRLVANYIYQFPNWFSSRKAMNRLMGGWQIAGVTTLSQGTPYTIFNNFNPLGILPGQVGTVAFSQRASFNPSGAEKTATPAANARFIADAADSGVIGNLGANTERVGNTYSFDASLSKEIKLYGERHRMQLRWDVLNVFNRRNFSTIPSNFIDSNTNLTTFMNLGYTDVAGRTMTLNLRYIF
ncbi:MAG: carboxypeptidase regulatory-like domain-containing protein [Bryobacteraceae bacterium]|nr:carboxypeptidase regulatory-like domain-containing protein [Bryobacteraceae bacterium]